MLIKCLTIITIINTHIIKSPNTNANTIPPVPTIRIVNIASTTKINNNIVNNNKYIFDLVGPAEMNISLNDTYIDIGYMARDKDGNNIANLVSVDGGVDTTKIGSYKVTYTLTRNNKDITIERRVNVVKTNDLLTLILKGNKTVNLKTANIYEEEGYSAVDSVEGDLNNSVKIANYVDYSTPGTYTIVYYVTNNKNIAKVAYRTINITN